MTRPPLAGLLPRFPEGKRGRPFWPREANAVANPAIGRFATGAPWGHKPCGKAALRPLYHGGSGFLRRGPGALSLGFKSETWSLHSCNVVSAQTFRLRAVSIQGNSYRQLYLIEQLPNSVFCPRGRRIRRASRPSYGSTPPKGGLLALLWTPPRQRGLW